MASRKPYIPDQGSVAGALIIEWSRPGVEPEPMLLSEIESEFGCPVGTAAAEIADAVRAGWFAKVPATKGLYKPGPVLQELGNPYSAKGALAAQHMARAAAAEADGVWLDAAPVVATPTTTPAEPPATPSRTTLDDATPAEWDAAAKAARPASKPGKGRPRALEMPDVATLPIIYRPRLMRRTATGGKWDPLFERLRLEAQPTGTHLPTLELHRSYVGAIKKAALTWNKQHPEARVQALLDGPKLIVQRLA